MVTIYNNKKINQNNLYKPQRTGGNKRTKFSFSSFLPCRFQGPVSGCQAQLFTCSDILRVSS